MTAKMNRKVKLYSVILFVVASLLFAYLILNFSISNYWELVFWVFIVALSETFTIRLPNDMAISVSLGVSLAVIITSGPLAAVIAGAIGMSLRMPFVSELNKRRTILNTHPIKLLFNFSEMAITCGISGLVYLFLGGELMDFSIVPALGTVIVYVVLNNSIVSLLYKFLTGNKFSTSWRQNSGGIILNTLAVGSFGIILALAKISYGFAAVILFLGPLFLARYSFKLYTDTKKMYFETIESFNKAIEAKDSYTSGHSSRVQEISLAVATEMRLSPKVQDRIKTAAILHDIGKIGIEDNILLKPGELTFEEYERIKEHPVIGSEIIKDVNQLKRVSKIVRHHHERYDGNGYPDGLKGTEIPLESRILAIADMYDAMTSDRPYRSALTEKEVFKELEIARGTQADPDVCDALMKYLKREKKNGN